MPDSRDSLIADCRHLMGEGKWNEARARLEQALAANPTDVLIAYTLATAYRLSGASDRARTIFGSLNAALPEMSEAATGLALVDADLGRAQAALDLLQRFAIRHPGVAQVYATAGEIALKSSHFDSVIPAFSRAVMLAPTAAQHGNLAEVLSLRHSFQDAERHYRHALELDPDSPSLRLNYAVHLLSQGKVRDGWQAFEARLDPRIPDAPVRTLSLPRWDGSGLSDRHLLVVSEQGLGDEIRLASLLPDLLDAAGAVTVECDPRLVSLFARAMPKLRAKPYSRVKRAGHGHYTYGWLPEKDGPDCYIELGSLPLRLNLPLRDPKNAAGYLRPQPDLANEIGKELRAKARSRRLVGLSWLSGAQQFGRATNYPPLTVWRDLLDLPDVGLVSLQYGVAEADVRALSELAEREILNLEHLELRDDLESLAALGSCLDLVLSVGNATAALTGAVGTPTIELLSTPGWVPRIGEQDTFLGANLRCAQTRQGDWSGPVTRARSLALQQLQQS